MYLLYGTLSVTNQGNHGLLFVNLGKEFCNNYLLINAL